MHTLTRRRKTEEPFNLRLCHGLGNPPEKKKINWLLNLHLWTRCKKRNNAFMVTSSTKESTFAVEHTKLKNCGTKQHNVFKEESIQKNKKVKFLLWSFINNKIVDNKIVKKSWCKQSRMTVKIQTQSVGAVVCKIAFISIKFMSILYLK